MKFFFLSCLLVLFNFSVAQAQDSLLVKTLEQNRYPFYYMPHSGGFEGEGWYKVVEEANKSQYTLIGETHGINELPLLINGLTSQVQFQTFVAEIDPWLAQILEEKVSKTPAADRQKWYTENNSFLSFFSYKNDFELLEKLSRRNIKFAGIDQISSLNDVPVYEQLASRTRNKALKASYKAMAAASRTAIQEYAEGKTKKPYLATDQFKTDLQKLRTQKLSTEEQQVLDALELSHQIYTNRKGSHQRRINLMKQQLMEYYQQGLLNQKALFRLGAMHSSRNESYFTIFDVGNLAHNLAESQNNSSFHMAIFAKAGETGTPFKSMPPQKVTQQKQLAPFFALASDTAYTYFDLRPVRELLEKQKLVIEDDFLRKTIKGYDGLVIVPVATASEF